MSLQPRSLVLLSIGVPPCRSRWPRRRWPTHPTSSSGRPAPGQMTVPRFSSAGSRSSRPAAAVMSRNCSPTMRCSTPAVFTPRRGRCERRHAWHGSCGLGASGMSASGSTPIQRSWVRRRDRRADRRGIDMIHWERRRQDRLGQVMIRLESPRRSSPRWPYCCGAERSA